MAFYTEPTGYEKKTLLIQNIAAQSQVPSLLLDLDQEINEILIH